MWSSFEWSTMRNFSEGAALSFGPFQKIQREVIYFFYLVIKKWKVAVNCIKIVAYMVKVVICLVLIISKQQYPPKKQYPWCLKLKLFDLVWVGIWREGHGTLLLPQWLRPSYWTSKLLGYIPENRSLFDNFKGREDVK